MYYSFSNSGMLYEMAKKGLLNELTEEFTKSDIVLHEKHIGICFSAEVLYKIICEAFSRAKKVVPDIVKEHAVKLFTKAWDVESLKFIKSSHGKYGMLDEAAQKVLSEYNYYSDYAIGEYNSSPKYQKFEKEIKEIGSDGVVTVVYDEGRLSFFRKGREFVMYYGDDFA